MSMSSDGSVSKGCGDIAEGAPTRLGGPGFLGVLDILQANP